MRLEITGHLDAAEEFADTVLDGALTLWVNKIAKDNPDMGGMLEKVEAVDVTSLTAEMRFKLEDNEDWQVITTDNHEGIPELLTVTVETDEQGNLLTDTVSDNDGESNFNELEAMIAKGISKEYTPVISAYSEQELYYKASHKIDDYWVYIYTDNEDKVVVQASEVNWQGDTRLIAEVVFPEDQLGSILAHYKELAEVSE